MFDVDDKWMSFEPFRIWQKSLNDLEKLLGRVDAPKPGFVISAEIDMDGLNKLKRSFGHIVRVSDSEMRYQICSAVLKFKGHGISGVLQFNCAPYILATSSEVYARTKYGGYAKVRYTHKLDVDALFVAKTRYHPPARLQKYTCFENIQHALDIAYKGEACPKPARAIPKPTAFSGYYELISVKYTMLGVVTVSGRDVVGVRVDDGELVFDGIGPDDQPYFLIRMVLRKNKFQNKGRFYFVTDGVTHYYPINAPTRRTKRLYIQPRFGSGRRKLSKRDLERIVEAIAEWSCPSS